MSYENAYLSNIKKQMEEYSSLKNLTDDARKSKSNLKKSEMSVST